VYKKHEQSFKMPTYEYPRPGYTADSIIFGYDGTELKVLLIKRGDNPFKDRWAIPGGFCNEGETSRQAAKRELMEETGVVHGYMEQLGTYDTPGRDPRGWTATVAYFALVNLTHYNPKGADDAKEAKWFSINKLPSALAFDHAIILRDAIQRLRAKVTYAPVGFELLTEKFTMTDLQALYETLLGISIDKRNFRRKMTSLNFIVPLNEKETKVGSSRPARLYRFDKKKYEAPKNFHVEF